MIAIQLMQTPLWLFLPRDTSSVITGHTDRENEPTEQKIYIKNRTPRENPERRVRVETKTKTKERV